MRLYTRKVNSEGLPGYNLVISCPGVLQQRNTVLMTLGFALGQSALYFCCSTPGQDITNTYMSQTYICTYVCIHVPYIHMYVCVYTCPIHTYVRTYSGAAAHVPKCMRGAQIFAQLSWSSPTIVFYGCAPSTNQNGGFHIE